MNWTWIVTAVAIVGVIANIYKRSWCFVLWLFTNGIWMIVDFNAGLYAQAFLFAVYFVLAIWGLIQWRQPDKSKPG